MSQVNFFMDENDDEEFIAMLRARSDTALFVGRFFDTPTPTPQRIPNYGSRAELELVNTSVAPTPVCHGRGAGEYRGRYLFDSYSDLHIEFTRSRLENRVLVAGRIYAKIGWAKPEEVNKVGRAWYGSLERWIKKRYRRHRGIWWIGPSAEKWSLAGGRLAFGDLNALVETVRETG